MPIALVSTLLLANGHALQPPGLVDEARPSLPSTGDLDRDGRPGWILDMRGHCAAADAPSMRTLP